MPQRGQNNILYSIFRTCTQDKVEIIRDKYSKL